MMGCYRSRDKALTSLSLVKQIESNIGWFGLERQLALRLIALCVPAEESESIEIGGANDGRHST